MNKTKKIIEMVYFTTIFYTVFGWILPLILFFCGFLLPNNQIYNIAIISFVSWLFILVLMLCDDIGSDFEEEMIK